jgi:hypothetical protein
MYTRGVERELTDRYLTRFNAGQMTAQEMRYICQVLGVSYVVAHTSATVEVLQAMGFQQVAQVDLGDLEHFREIVRTPAAITPAVTLTLLRNPLPATVAEPPVPWERKGNELTWKAKAGQSYVVRYRHSPDFRAYQHGEMLKVEPIEPFSGLSLTFMQVKAIADGPIVLQFHPRWI